MKISDPWTSSGLALVAALTIGALGKQLGSRGEGARIPKDSTVATHADEHEVARASWAKRELHLLTRIQELEVELAVERDMRATREREWFEFTRLITHLDIPTAPATPEFLQVGASPADDLPTPAGQPINDDPSADQVSVDPVPTISDAELEKAERRSRVLRRELRAYLMAEQFGGLDILEVGVVAQGWTGPIVARLVDDYGRPVGTLAANRLRLEGSIAAHSVTLIFEEGYEVRGGVRVPFGIPERPGDERGGVRRIYLPGIDPRPWISAFPELFGEGTIDISPDDGTHDLLRLRLDLNELLRASTRAGHWRVRALGGVRGEVLRDVQLVELDVSGHQIRRLFADQMSILRRGDGIELLLEGGVQERLGRRAPFLEGRYRVILPKVHMPSWLAAELPGLGAESEAAGQSQEEAPNAEPSLKLAPEGESDASSKVVD
ncbi:MAG: hypothetical protein ACI841_003844 [Planctomycetota bacterium]|jgi:hypothetical protein